MAGYRGKLNRHIRLKGKAYQFKIAIPADCQAFFKGSKNYVETTGTGDLVTARRWRDRREREMLDMFMDIRTGRMVSDEVTEAVRFAKLSRKALQNETDEEQRFLISTLALDHSESLEAKPDLQKAFDKAWSGKEEIDAHLEAWLAEALLAPKTTHDYRGIIGRLTRWAKDKHLSIPDINRKMAGVYVTKELLDPDKMTKATAKKHMTAITGYWDYLRRRGHLPSAQGASPWSEQIMPERGKQGTVKEEERALTDEELIKVLYDNVLTQRGTVPDWQEELKEMARIAALSGMRIGEITSLTVAACQGGRFDLAKAKSEAGVRTFPIHSQLVDLIAKRCTGPDGAAREGTELLFKEFENLPNASDTLSKAFTRRRVALGVHEKPEGKRRSLVNFHSIRRTFATKAAHADIPEAILQEVIGHDTGEKKTVLRKSYVKEVSWEQKVRCVEAVKLPPPRSHAEAVEVAEAA